MAKASTRVRNDKEPRKRGRPPKKKFQPPSRTQVEVQVPPTPEVVSKPKPRPWPIPQKKVGTPESSAATVPGGSSSTPDVGATRYLPSPLFKLYHHSGFLCMASQSIDSIVQSFLLLICLHQCMP
ncbi:hypothetical protein P692DRAFT_201785804 [Suillus brevipes Sb2]|nr:hypothetical protein P692DRAFT_201785804 [Suillus brevipes Sb2]